MLNLHISYNQQNKSSIYLNNVFVDFFLAKLMCTEATESSMDEIIELEIWIVVGHGSKNKIDMGCILGSHVLTCNLQC